VKNIDEVRKKSLYIKMKFKKGQQQNYQEDTNITKGKKFVVIIEKGKDPKKHCKHYDMDGHIDEKRWWLHPKLHPKLCKFKKGIMTTTKM